MILLVLVTLILAAIVVFGSAFASGVVFVVVFVVALFWLAKRLKT
jgi:hypothetical protein